MTFFLILEKKITKCNMKLRPTSSLHGPYVLGYTRVTMVLTECCNDFEVQANL